MGESRRSAGLRLGEQSCAARCWAALLTYDTYDAGAGGPDGQWPAGEC